MFYLTLIFSFSLCIIFIRAGFIQDKLFEGIVMHIDRLDSECHGRNVPCQSIIRGFTTTSTKIFVENCSLIVKEGSFKKLMLNIVISRCRSKENLDTCEQYLKQDNIDFCKAIDPSNPLISNSPFYTPFEPPLKCPLEKGIYRAHNVSFDVAPFILFKLDGWYWKVKTEVFSEKNKLVFCSYMDGYITNSKTRTKTKTNAPLL